MSFASLGLLPELVTAVTAQGYDKPSPIQHAAIPAILKGRDVMAAAQTGTGKTAGFTLPLLQRLSAGPKAGSNQARALILAPTRELAMQVAESVKTYSQHTTLKTTVVYGGVKINPQMQRLRSGTDILIATPGRLLDLADKNAVKLDRLEILVLDEADRMLDMGFINDIRDIMKLMPKKRQTLMFSATFSHDVRNLAKTLVNNPEEISVSPLNTTATNVEQWLCPVDKKQKPYLLGQLLDDNDWQQVLVFCLTKKGTDHLVQFLKEHDIKSSAIHGDKPQSARTRAIEGFKNGTIKVLVATDIAARGIDIDQLPQVINFDLPIVAADYIHRIGRTGRAGASGTAISLVSADEFKQLSNIERLIGYELTRKFVDGFEPDHNLPQSTLTKKIKRPKKPKIKGSPKSGRGKPRAGASQQTSKKKIRTTSKKKTARNSSSRGRNKKRSQADKSTNTGNSSAQGRRGRSKTSARKSED